MKNTELLLSFEDVKANKEVILPRISEGCKELEKILNYCVDYNMPTIACCSGHHFLDHPYITMYYDQSTRKKINAFLNQLVDVKGIDICFSTTGFTNHPFNVTVYTNMRNRDSVFSMIASSLELNMEEEYLNENMNLCLNLAIDMDYQMKYSTVSIFHKRFQREYLVGLYGPQVKGNIFDEYKNRKRNNDIGMTYYLYRSHKKLKLVVDSLENLIPNYQFRNGFMISNSSSVNDKVDRMSELNTLLKEENGTIRRPR